MSCASLGQTYHQLKQLNECKGTLQRALNLSLSPQLSNEAKRTLADCSQRRKHVCKLSRFAQRAQREHEPMNSHDRLTAMVSRECNVHEERSTRCRGQGTRQLGEHEPMNSRGG